MTDTLTLLVSALRSGYSLARAAQVVAEEMPPPISEEFAVALGEMALGLPLAAALARMAERVGSPDLELIVTAVTTQQQAGGNLAEILGRIAGTIRERVRVQGEIRTLTAEGQAVRPDPDPAAPRPGPAPDAARPALFPAAAGTARSAMR